MQPWAQTAIQIALAGGLGAAIGLERELGAQPAGLRTHMLVSLGAGVFTLAGTDLLGSDPTRVAAQVVTGIGFLGGGAILREGASIRGLTTAASLWVTAAVGLAVGLRNYFAAISATVIALLVLSFLKYVEREILPRKRVMEVTLTLLPGVSFSEVEREVENALPRTKVVRVQYRQHEQELVMVARPRLNASLADIGEQLLKLEGVEGVDIAR